MTREEMRDVIAKEDMEMFLNIDIAELEAITKAIIEAKRIFVAGWGRAGNCVKILSMNCSQMGLKTHIVGDNSTPSIHEGDLLVIGSGKGTTETMVEIAKQCKEHGAKLALITAAKESTIGDMADMVVHIPRKEFDPDGVPMARGSYYQVLVMTVDLIMAYVMQDLGLKGEVIGFYHNNLE